MHTLLAIKERQSVTDECPVMLKDRAMARVGIEDELRSTLSVISHGIRGEFVAALDADFELAQSRDLVVAHFFLA